MNELKLLVYIVDDEHGMCSAGERCLRNYTIKEKDFTDEISFVIKTFSTGKDAIKEIKSSQPDILILDYKLPDMNGLEVLESIKEKKFLTIVITAFASLDVAISATKKGAFDFLSKPFTPDELRESVRKAAKTIYTTRKMKALEEEKKNIRFEFISILAHELKSPLAAIEGYLSLMDERIKGNKVDDYDSMIKRSIERINSMRKLIADIIDLTKLESGKKKRNIEKINIRDLISQIIEGFEKQASQKNIRIKFVCDDMFINADISDMNMLVSNFLSNAIKYNRENGSVDIVVLKERNGIKLIFKDTGIGIKKEDIKKLFNEFVRIKNEQTRNIEGSGLGLSIVKKIVDHYNGSISMDSEFGRGTTFEVFLDGVIENTVAEIK